MDQSETLRIHRNVNDWLRVGFPLTAYHVLGERDFSRLPLLVAVDSRRGQDLSLHIPPDLAGQLGRNPEVIKQAVALERIAIMAPNDLLEMRKLLRQIADLEGVAPPPDAIGLIGAFYDALHERTGGLPHKLASLPLTDLSRDLDDVFKEDPRIVHGLIWRLTASDHPLKPAFANLVQNTLHCGIDICYARHTRRVYATLAESIRELDTAKKDAARVEQRLREADRENIALRDRAKRAESELENASLPAHAPSIPHAPEDISTYQQLVELHEAEARAANDARILAEGKLRQAGTMVNALQAANARLAERLRESSTAKRLANGTGIEVYAHPVFVERYPTFCTYRDERCKEGEFVGVIEDNIARVCRSIKDEGQGAGGKAFVFYDTARLYVRRDQQVCRLFFQTDFRTRVVLCDAVTPAEHQGGVSSGSGGRYRQLMAGEIAFDEKAHLVRVHHTLDELLGKGADAGA